MRVQSPENENMIAAMFDRVAPRYDLLNRMLSARQDQRWRRHLVGAMPFRPAGALLDVATGTGDVLLAARAAHPEYEVLAGVDIAPGMLQRASRKLSGLVPPVDLRLMSATDLGFQDRSFDCVTIAFGLRNVVDRPAALREFRRVLKPGGALLVLEFFPADNGLLAAAFQFYFRWLLPLIGGLISDRRAYQYLPASVGSFYDRDSFRAALSEAGFRWDFERRFLGGGCRLVRAVVV